MIPTGKPLCGILVTHVVTPDQWIQRSVVSAEPRALTVTTSEQGTGGAGGDGSEETASLGGKIYL